MKTSLFSSRRFNVSAVIITLCLAMLVGTPYLIRYVVEQWLLANGGDQVHIQNVDFNPFTAALKLEDLHIQVNAKTTLSFQSAGLDLAWMPLLHRRFDVQSAELTGFNVVIDNRDRDSLKLGGIGLLKKQPATGEPGKKDSGWMSGIQALTLQDCHILVQDSRVELDIVLEHLHMRGLTQWSPEQPAVLGLVGTINNAAVKFDGKLTPLASQPHYEGDLLVTNLPLTAFERLAGPNVRRLSGLLSFDGSLVFRQSGASFALKEEGAVTLDALKVGVRKPALDIQNKRLSFTGNFSLADSGSEQSIQVASDVSVEGLGIAATERKISLVNADTGRISGLLIQGLNNISAKEVASGRLYLGNPLDGKAATEGRNAFFSTRKLQILGLSLSNRLVSADLMVYEDLHNRILRNRDGTWNVVRFMEVMKTLNETPDSPDKTGHKTSGAPGHAGHRGQGDPIAIRINRIQVSGNSAILFSDQSVKPPFAVTLKVQDASLEHIDSRQPKQESPVTLKGGVGKYTRVSLNGNVQPFLHPLGMNLRGKIYAMDLPSFSSYTRESLGLVLDSGTLDADVTLASQQERLDGKVGLKLHQLELENVKSENSLQSRLPFPLNAALNTLRDKHNTIELDIPVKGNAGDPEFDVSNAISQALATGLRKGALSYLTLALQPYGTLIVAAQYAGETIARVRLDPIEFEPGRSTLDESDLDYLSKVARVLKDRPKLAIKLCGVAVQQDRLFYQQQRKTDKQGEVHERPASGISVMDERRLTELAARRAAAVKDYLVEKYQVPANHLVGCRPRVGSDEADGKPRTDLLI